MKKYKRTLLVLSQLPPPHHGMSLLNEALERELKESFEKNSRELLRIVVINTSFNKSTRIKTLLFLLTIPFRIFLLNPSVVYITPSFRWPIILRDVFFVMLTKATRSRIYLHIHDGIIYRYNSNRLMRNLISILFKHNSIITSNKNTRDLVMSNWPKVANTYVINNGIQPFTSFTAKPKDLGESKNKFVLYLSRIEEEKGIFEILKNLTSLNNHGYKLYCAGTIDKSIWEAIYKKYHSEIDKGDVIFLNRVEDNEKYWLIDNCQFLVYPTNLDDFPLVLIEALQRGCSIICRSIGGISCLNSKNIILYDKLEDLRPAINVYINDKAFSLKDNLASQTARTTYSLDQYTRAIKNILYKEFD